MSRLVVDGFADKYRGISDDKKKKNKETKIRFVVYADARALVTVPNEITNVFFFGSIVRNR